MRKSFFKLVVFSTLVYFFSWFGFYKTGVNKLAIQSEDTLPALFMPVTIIKEGTIFLDTYVDEMVSAYPDPTDRYGKKGLLPFYLRQVTKQGKVCDAVTEECVVAESAHYVSAFTIITPLLAVPVYLIPVLAGVPINLDTVTILGHITAALIVGLSGGFLYVLLRRYFFRDNPSVNPSISEKRSLLLTFVYLFATINYAQISQALWQHGTVQLFTILSLLSIYDKKKFLTGLFFGLTILSRPTGSLSVAFLGMLALYVWYFDPEEPFHPKDLFKRLRLSDKKAWIETFLHFVLGILPSVLFFLWYNRAFYGTIANQGYADQFLTEWRGRFPEGFLGIWMSPSKGILIYSPILGFSLYGAYLAFKEWAYKLPYVISFLAIITHILVYGKWKHWFGGWSFGYRMASDVLPFFMLLLVPVVVRLGIFVVEDNFPKALKIARKFFWISLVYSVLIQLYGIALYDGMWHAAYDQGDINTSWLWSIKNSEIAFNIRRVLVRLGVLDSAF
jgi:hypothetical protein